MLKRIRRLLLRIPAIRAAVADFQRRARAEQKPMLRLVKGETIRTSPKRQY